MTQLLSLISSTSSPISVDGAMRVLNDFISVDLTEDQLLPIAQNLLPQILTILSQNETHSFSTRARGVLIFRQCVMTLFTVKEEHPQAVKTAVGEILPVWLNAFAQLLERDPVEELQGKDGWEPLAIRTAIFNVSVAQSGSTKCDRSYFRFKGPPSNSQQFPKRSQKFLTSLLPIDNITSHFPSTTLSNGLPFQLVRFRRSHNFRRRFSNLV